MPWVGANTIPPYLQRRWLLNFVLTIQTGFFLFGLDNTMSKVSKIFWNVDSSDHRKLFHFASILEKPVAFMGVFHRLCMVESTCTFTYRDQLCSLTNVFWSVPEPMWKYPLQNNVSFKFIKLVLLESCHALCNTTSFLSLVSKDKLISSCL